MFFKQAPFFIKKKALKKEQVLKFMKIITSGPNQTKKQGELLAKNILGKKARWKKLKKEKFIPKTALIIGLEGDLGGGKTTFLQGFAKGLGISQKILSPTFVIMKRFRVKDLNFKDFYHIDCYRIEKKKEVRDLGLKKIISDSRNIVAIEWADRIKEILPGNSLTLKFKFIGENKRKIWLSKKKD